MIPENLPLEKKCGRTHKIWKQFQRFVLSLSAIAMFALPAQNLQAKAFPAGAEGFTAVAE